MSGKLQNPPLIYVIGKVQFNQIAQMAKWAGDIQGFFRKEGDFLDYSPEVLRFPQVWGIPQAEEITRWRYGTMKGDSRYFLECGSLCFETVAYDNFQTFQDLILDGLKKVNDMAGLNVTASVGLRFLNIFAVRETMGLRHFLAPEVCALLKGVGEGSVETYTFDVHTRERDNINISRKGCYSARGPLVPGDIDPGFLGNNPQFIECAKQKRTITLDLSCYIEESCPFGVDDITEKLSILHGHCKEAFLKSVTSEALREWGEGANA